MRAALWERFDPPAHIRIRQVAYDRFHAVHRMRAAGMVYREIGKRLGISAGRASQLDRMWTWKRYANRKQSPVEEWLSGKPSPGHEIIIWWRRQLPKDRKPFTVEEAYTIVNRLSTRQRVALMIVLDDMKENGE